MTELGEFNCSGYSECVSGSLHVEVPANIGAQCDYSGDCSIGAYTYVNGFCEFTSVAIGRYCSIARHVIAGSGEHFTEHLTTHPFATDPSDSSSGLLRSAPEYAAILGSRLSGKNDRKRRGTVSIGHDVWIGTRVTILNGVEIGHGAIVGAGAVVTRSVAPYSIVAGNPARVIRSRFPADTVQALLDLAWWNYDLAPITAEVDYSDPEAAIEIIGNAIQVGRLSALAPREISIVAGVASRV